MNANVKAELDKIAAESEDKRLHAEAVVEAAREPTSALHAEFEWDDAEAAAKHRLTTARQLIRLYVRYEPSVGRSTRAYVSVPSDRGDRGGYRNVTDVLKRPDLVRQFSEEARAKIVAMREHYAFVKEMDPLWSRLLVVVDEFAAAPLPAVA